MSVSLTNQSRLELSNRSCDRFLLELVLSQSNSHSFIDLRPAVWRRPIKLSLNDDDITTAVCRDQAIGEKTIAYPEQAAFYK